VKKMIALILIVLFLGLIMFAYAQKEEPKKEADPAAELARNRVYAFHASTIAEIMWRSLLDTSFESCYIIKNEIKYILMDSLPNK